LVFRAEDFYTAAQPIMQVKKEFWKMLLLLSSATRCNRAGAGMQSRGSRKTLQNSAASSASETTKKLTDEKKR